MCTRASPAKCKMVPRLVCTHGAKPVTRQARALHLGLKPHALKPHALPPIRRHVIVPVIKHIHVPLFVPRFIGMGTIAKTLGHMFNPLAHSKPPIVIPSLRAARPQIEKTARAKSSEEEEENSSGINLNIYKFN